MAKDQSNVQVNHRRAREFRDILPDGFLTKQTEMGTLRTLDITFTTTDDVVEGEVFNAQGQAVGMDQKSERIQEVRLRLRPEVLIPLMNAMMRAVRSLPPEDLARHGIKFEDQPQPTQQGSTASSSADQSIPFEQSVG